MYLLRIDARVEKELRNIPTKDQHRILDKIQQLTRNPRPHGCQKLAAQFAYRIRQGDYRVLYEIDDKKRTVTVYRAGHRSQIYNR